MPGRVHGSETGRKKCSKAPPLSEIWGKKERQLPRNVIQLEKIVETILVISGEAIGMHLCR